MSSDQDDRYQAINIWNNFIDGDENAFSELYNKYYDIMFCYGVKFISDKEQVKDSIQDVFVKIFNHRTNLASNINPHFYLLRSLKNTLLDSLPQKSKHISIDANNYSFSIDYEWNSSSELELEQHDQEIKEKFEKVMSMLTPKQKEAIYLRFQLGLSYDEISLLLNINYQSVRNLIYRSFEKIRTELGLSIFLILFQRITY